MEIKIGDLVSIIAESAEGHVVELHNNGLISVEIDGFPFDYELHELMKVNKDTKTADFVIAEKDLKFPMTQKTKTAPVELIDAKLLLTFNNKGVPELDLHIHELVKNTGGMTNADMLELQLKTLKKFFRVCEENHVNEFVVIHGVGEGVLKTEVRKWIEALGHCELRDGDYREYGYGATHVKIKGLFT